MDVFEFTESMDASENNRPQMNASEFIEGAKAVLNRINSAYEKAWHDRCLTISELDVLHDEQEPPFIIRDGQKIEVFFNRETGDYFEHTFDSDGFAEQIEDIMFNDSSNAYLDLLTCEINPDPLA